MITSKILNTLFVIYMLSLGFITREVCLRIPEVVNSTVQHR